MEVGGRLTKDGMVAIDFSEGDFVAAPDFSLLTTSVMPIIHIKNSVARAVGTCFAISSDGLCLTARHVIEEALPGPVLDGTQNTEADGWLYALYVSDERVQEKPEHTLGGLLPVHKVHLVDILDIAAVQLQLPQHAVTKELLRMPASRLGLGLPTPGAACLAFGYHSMEWEGIDPSFKVAQKFYSSRGIIEEVHLPRRDAVMAPFPCFRTSARYDAGMSGGPVMGIDGLVRGVVCSSIHGLNSDDGFISYVSLVGPAVLIQVERVNKEGLSSKYFIGDLLDRRIISADTVGVTLERLEHGLRLHIGGGIITNSVAQGS